ncbi:MAG: hypothetical protein ACXVFK_13290 [Solirubrobacteraceae bacterium]
MSGQATTDYVAVLLVVLATVVGVATWADGHALADGVEHAFARAVCIARGGGSECDIDIQPCVVAADDRTDGVSVRLGFLRLGRSYVLLREERSDGTVLITKGRLTKAGLGVALGAEGHVHIGSVNLAEGATIDGSAEGLFDRSRSWLVHGSAAADRLVARVRHGDEPPPDMTSNAKGLESSLKLSGTIAPKIGASLGIAAKDVKTLRTDAATGRRTIYVQRTDEAAVSLSAVEFGARGQAEVVERYGVTLDRDGRPLDLVVLRQGTLPAAADLPRRLRLVAGLLSQPTRGGRMWVEETHLDLTDPANLAVARSFLAQITGAPAVGLGSRADVARALAARLGAVGIEHVRTMEVQSTSSGAGGELDVGGGAGWSSDHTTIHRRLLGAATRGIDGVWRMRTDCLATA